MKNNEHNALLKNDKKCTPYVENMTENRLHGGQKGIL